MRNFNSHLSDDSQTTGIGNTVKQIGKVVLSVGAAGNALAALDPTGKSKLSKLKNTWNGSVNETNSVAGGVTNPEYTEQSIVKRAGEYLDRTDVLTAFWTDHDNHTGDVSNPANPLKGKTQVNNSDFNAAMYALNNYRMKLGSTLFVQDITGTNGAGSFNIGTVSMFNPGLLLDDGGMLHPLSKTLDSRINAKNRWVYYALNPTVRNLVEHPRGRAIYSYEDFMYCADLGKISNNHLITLRKFAAPAGDNIFKATNARDMGHLVCYFGGKDNKLDDIMRMNFHATWKEFEGKWQEQDTNSEANGDSLIGKISNILSGRYRADVKRGSASISGMLGSGFSSYNNSSQSAYYNKQYGMYDQNKIYTPKNIVNKTHQYEGMMEFNQQIKLTFRYKMRSYHDVNQKAAFMDLINNILHTTYRRASWWGGGVWWKGAPQNMAPFNTANAFVDGFINKAGGIWNSLFDKDFAGNFGSISGIFTALGEIASKLLEGVSALVTGVMGAGEQLVNQTVKSGDGDKGNTANSSKTTQFVKAVGNIGLDILQGAMKNKLGRPQVYALNSILSGAAVGPWHVTIGNPYNPIATIGNLIIDDVQLQTGGALGIDDFPEELICTITLKHAKPRDLTAVASMFTAGRGEIGLPMSSEVIEKHITRPVGMSTGDSTYTKANRTRRQEELERYRAEVEKEQKELDEKIKKANEEAAAAEAAEKKRQEAAANKDAAATGRNSKKDAAGTGQKSQDPKVAATDKN